MIKKLISSGLSLIPIVKKKKNPAMKAWSKHMEQAMTYEEFKKHGEVDSGIVCGEVSGNLEVLDFDNHFGDAEQLFDNFYNQCEGVLEIMEGEIQIPVIDTRSGGFHLYYRCSEIDGSRKLAMRINDKGRSETLIETRGEQAYVVAPPTDGYKLVQGDLLNIPTITIEQRQTLLNACKSMNEVYSGTSARRTEFEPTTSRADCKSAGDEYNEDLGSIAQTRNLLEQCGWTCDKTGKRWARPTKSLKNGLSATFGVVAPNMFYVFSSNAHPFEQKQGYLPFAVLAMTQYNGDYAEAVKGLVELGYGTEYTLKTKIAQAASRGYKLADSEISEIAEKSKLTGEKIEELVEQFEEDSPVVKASEVKDKKKKIPINVACDFIKKNYEIRFNTISNEYQYQEIGTDQWKLFSSVEFQRKAGLQGKDIKDTMFESVIGLDEVKTDYSPFQEYFDSVKARKKTKGTIANLAKHFKLSEGTSPEYFAEMLKKALIRSIKCSLEPYYTNRIIFTLISSSQEIGKTYFIKWLNPFESLEYYTESGITGGKDDKIALAKNFIFNLDEVDSLGRIGIAKLKATISTSVINERLPYAKTAIAMPRCASFWASTNNHNFLEDHNNTRWICTTLEGINRKYSKNIDKDDMWSEAYNLYLKGYDCELSNKETEIRHKDNAAIRHISHTEELVDKYITEDSDCRMNTSGLYQQIKLAHGETDNSFTVLSLGKALGAAGYKRSRKHDGAYWNVKLKVGYNPLNSNN